MTTKNAHLMLHPGPVSVPEYVIKAIGQPLVHQRSTAFRSFFSDLQANLRYVFQTEGPVIAMPGSGTFGVEAAMFSLFKAGDQVAIPAIGKFSERWAAFGMALGLDVVPLGLSWGQAITKEHVTHILKEYPQLSGWVLTHVETSTGAAVDLEEIAAAIKKFAPQQLVVADAICSVGIQPVYSDAWQLDAVVAASQKGFLNPAGTVYVAVSPLATTRLSFPDAADYRDLGHYLRYLQNDDYPFTPPTQLFFGVNAALGRMREEGLPAIWNRTHIMSRRFKAGIETMGATLFGASNADALTVFSFGRIDHDELREQLVQRFGIEVSGGQDRLSEHIIRVGHFGPIGLEEMETVLKALQKLRPREDK